MSTDATLTEIPHSQVSQYAKLQTTGVALLSRLGTEMHLTGGISSFEVGQNMSLSNTSVLALNNLIKVNKI